ncbi:MAG TPA: alpha/beta hydrolase [Burkholderiales bacterium]|nr:alpha/beta hydrolase [Burkholderiales bacterium]
MGLLSTTLVVPGLHGSGPDHWQTWFERQVPEARRVEQTNWEQPVLARWAEEVRRGIDLAEGAVWIVAHSFGCLAAVAAAAERCDRVAAALLVAPADPDRFSTVGLCRDGDRSHVGVGALLPREPLGFPSLVVASGNDPWAPLTKAAYWANLWGSRLHFLGNAGHINPASGFGPWPEGLALFRSMQETNDGIPLGRLDLRPRACRRTPS